MSNTLASLGLSRRPVTTIQSHNDLWRHTLLEHRGRHKEGSKCCSLKQYKQYKQHNLTLTFLNRRKSKTVQNNDIIYSLWMLTLFKNLCWNDTFWCYRGLIYFKKPWNRKRLKPNLGNKTEETAYGYISYFTIHLAAENMCSLSRQRLMHKLSQVSIIIKIY